MWLDILFVIACIAILLAVWLAASAVYIYRYAFTASQPNKFLMFPIKMLFLHVDKE